MSEKVSRIRMDSIRLPYDYHGIGPTVGRQSNDWVLMSAGAAQFIRGRPALS